MLTAIHQVIRCQLPACSSLPTYLTYLSQSVCFLFSPGVTGTWVHPTRNGKAWVKPLLWVLDSSSQKFLLLHAQNDCQLYSHQAIILSVLTIHVVPVEERAMGVVVSPI